MLTLTVTGLPAVQFGLAAVPVQMTVVLASSVSLYTQAQLRISWGDGSSSESTVSLPYTGTATHTLPVGTNTVRVTAVTVATPLLTVVHTSYVSVSAKNAPVASDPIVFGPIPPRVNGAPGIESWQWQTAADSIVLEARVTAILMTRRGERVMRPTFGSSIHQLLFSPADTELTTQIKDEVRLSISNSEPRVDVQNVDCKIQGRVAIVTVACRSKLNSSQFVLVIPFNG